MKSLFCGLRILNDFVMFLLVDLFSISISFVLPSLIFFIYLTGINDSEENLLAAIEKEEDEISPSVLFAVASILEGCPYINGSPQNTFVPGVLDMALRRNVPIGGDDFKTGQTKLKSVLVDWLVSSGIKPVAIASYNHLGNFFFLQNILSERDFVG